MEVKLNIYNRSIQTLFNSCGDTSVGLHQNLPVLSTNSSTTTTSCLKRFLEPGASWRSLTSDRYDGPDKNWCKDRPHATLPDAPTQAPIAMALDPLRPLAMVLDPPRPLAWLFLPMPRLLLFCFSRDSSLSYRMKTKLVWNENDSFV